MNAKNKQISSIEITNKERVKIMITETVILAPEEADGESREIVNTFPINMGYKPHKEYMEALLSTRKYALDLGEFADENRTQYTVQSMKITGNMAMQNSRVSFVLNKFVKRTGKNIKIAVGECTMYGDEYKDTTKMTKAVEKVLDETWKYINGKNGEGQICLSFASGEEEVAA